MHKKSTFFITLATILTLGFANFSILPASAIEGAGVNEGEIGEPTDDPSEDNGVIDLPPADNVTDAEPTPAQIIEERDCFGEDGKDCQSEVTEEPELWPVYLSLGALGAAFILIIIINILGRKKQA